MWTDQGSSPRSQAAVPRRYNVESENGSPVARKLRRITDSVMNQAARAASPTRPQRMPRAVHVRKLHGTDDGGCGTFELVRTGTAAR